MISKTSCPHYRPISPHAGSCALLRPHGVLAVAGPGNPNHPCPACRRAWAGGPGGPPPAIGDPLPGPLTDLLRTVEPPVVAAGEEIDADLADILRRGCCG